MTDEELIRRAREMWQWKHGHRTHPSAEEVDALLRAADERDELRTHVSLAGGYHSRTEREIEIRQALEETPPSERDSSDMAIGELLDLVDAGRNRVYTAEEVCDELRKRVAELERGEYICRECYLRKDGEAGPVDF